MSGGRAPEVEAAIAALPRTATLAAFEELAGSLGAKGTGANAILFSRSLSGGEYSGDAAKSVAEQLGWQVISNTPRGQFLSHPAVQDRLVEILRTPEGGGLDELSAQARARTLMNGRTNDHASLNSSYWGKASEEFAASTSGQILVINPDAIEGRQFDIIELRTLESNPVAPTRINSIPFDQVRDNPNALTEIKNASIRILGADGLVKLPAAGNGTRFALTREGGERLGLSASDLERLPRHAEIMKLPGAVALPELGEPQRAVVDAMQTVMRQRGDSERAISMATTIATERFRKLSTAASRSDGAPRTEVQERAAPSAQQPNTQPRADAKRERSPARERSL